LAAYYQGEDVEMGEKSFCLFRSAADWNSSNRGSLFLLEQVGVGAGTFKDDPGIINTIDQ